MLRCSRVGAGAAGPAPAASRAPGADRTNTMPGGGLSAPRVDGVRSNMLAKLGLSGGRGGSGGGSGGGRGRGGSAANASKAPQTSAFGAAFGAVAAAGADPASESR